MSEKKQKKKKAKNSGKTKIILSVMLLTILLMVELYVMINDSGNYINMGILVIIMLVFVYLLTTTILERSKREIEKNIEQYENIFKAEKASYLQLRKHHTETENHLINLEQNLKMPKDEIVSIQKSIAKITINRSKENADALMNSNDMLMQKLFQFEDLLEESNNRLLEKQKEIFEGYVQQILEKQSELEILLKRVEDSTEQEIEYRTFKQNNEEENIKPVLESSEEESIEPVLESSEEESIEPVLESFDEESIEPVLESSEEEFIEPVLENLEEESIEPVSESPEEESEELILEKTEKKEESIKSTEQAMDELLRAVSEPVPEPMPVPDLDSNRKMTPEEIAALFDNV